VLQILAGCPDCPIARDARAMFLELGVWHDLVIAVAPFAVCTAVVLLVARLAAWPVARRGGARARR